MNYRTKVRTCLWFERRGLEAAKFYVSLVPQSQIDGVYAHGRSDDPLVVEFTLHGAPMMILTAGPHYTLTSAASICILTKDQEETDHIYGALIANGGEEINCGWLKDRFGVTWQIVPEVLPMLLDLSDRAAAARVQEAMMTMKKIDIATLQAASRGDRL